MAMRGNLTVYVFSALLMIGVVVTNILANSLPINGLTTKQVSDLYPSLFTPQGFTFSIWAVIYIALISFVVYAFIRRESMIVERVLPWFALTSFLNMAWIVSWHFLLPALSVIIMVMLLASLGQIFRLTHSTQILSKFETLFIRFPFAIYFAWICVATIANVSALLVHWNWQGGPISPESWTIVMMTVATVVAAIVAWHYREWAHLCVTLWALFGIFSRWNDEHTGIRVAAALLMGALGLLFIYGLVRKGPVRPVV